jgi:phospholipase D1/2
VAAALVERIRWAHRQRRKFRVFIVLPLLPAFESEVSQLNGATVRLIIHYHLQTICRGDGSIVQQLTRHGIDWHEYISFCSLRTYGHLNSGHGPVASEQIYVHSKLLIVDDLLAIIGSANINDRSLLGHRDGELAVLVRDTPSLSTVLGGRSYQAGPFVHSLRASLFSEHLSETVDDVVSKDICSDEFFHGQWRAIAGRNSQIYRTLFRCIPDDTVRSWADYQQFIETPYRPVPGHLATIMPPDSVSQLLEQLQGHLVEFPTQFLADENLASVFPAKEFVLPADLFI